MFKKINDIEREKRNKYKLTIIQITNEVEKCIKSIVNLWSDQTS